MSGVRGGLIAVAVLALALPASARADVLVSEIQVAGASASDEFVELVNVGTPVNLDGAVLSFSGSDCESAPPPFALPAVVLGTGQHLLIGGTDYRGVDLPDATLDRGDRLGSDIGSVAFIPSSADDEVLSAMHIPPDAVGYGPLPELPPSGHTCYEGTPFPSAPAAGNSLERVRDTGDNATDFVVRSLPNPENLSGAHRAAPPGAAPPPPGAPPPPPQGQPQVFDGPQILGVRFAGRLVAGERVLLQVEARDPGLPTAGITVDFGDPGGVVGLDACRLGRQSGPFIHGSTTEFEVPHSFDRPGTYQVTVTVSSGGCFKNGNKTTFTLTVVIEPAAGDARAAAVAPPGPAVFGSQLRVPRRCRGAGSRVTSRSLRRSQAAVICLVNEVRRRASRRLRPLRRSTKLTRSALTHTRDMIRRRYFEHVGPGGPSLAQRLRRARYRSRISGENIGVQGLPTPVAIVNAWIESPPHFANMVSPKYRFAGVGIVARAAPPSFPRGVPAATFTINFGRDR